MTNETIIEAFAKDVDCPNKMMVMATTVFRSQIDPLGLNMKWFRFDADIKYKSYIHPDLIFCVLNFETKFSVN